jgi:23S rRNA pseudouridine1911/1915/1917 synthase
MSYPDSSLRTPITHEKRTIPMDNGGLRLDQAAALAYPEFSRSRLQQWLKEGVLILNGKPGRGRDKVLGGEVLQLLAEQQTMIEDAPEAMPLDIIYEDEDILVLNKAAGLVVHPAAGNREGTLLNGLLHHVADLVSIPRAGIVHRLDKDTSGLMVVAKTLEAHLDLVEQLQARTVSRIYDAVVYGVLTAGGKVDAPLGRHPSNRQKRAVSAGGDAREAVTHYRVQERYRSHTLVQCQLETGRTHQIRVHMAHIGHALLGDPLYGGRLRLPKGASPEFANFLGGFRRQALHARELTFEHPKTHEIMSFSATVPEDMQTLLSLLAVDAK